MTFTHALALATSTPHGDLVPALVVAGEPRWYAVHVRHNFELKTSQRLVGAGVETFFPTYRSVRQWTDRKVASHLPLFPGYLFVRTHWRNKLAIVNQSGVVSLVGGPESTIDEETIDRLRVAVASESVSPCEPSAFQPGDCVRVVSGVFSGMTGILQRWQGRTHLVVTLQTVARSFALHIEAHEVEPV